MIPVLAGAARTLLLGCIATLVFTITSVSCAEPMKFYGQPPMLPIWVGSNAWRIFAEGEIDQDAAERFQIFLREKEIPRKSLLFLNSPGGNLLAGMKLGKVIRSYGLFTYVGKERQVKQKNRPYDTIEGGECYSACAFIPRWRI